MNWLKIGAILLIIAGTLGLVYGQFTYDRDASSAAGPIRVTVKGHSTIDIPIWAAVSAIVAGSLVLLAHHRPRYRS